MNTISNFHSTLFILYESYENLRMLFFEFKKHPQTGIESLSNPFLKNIRDYMIMESASFLEEYEINFLEINNRTPIHISTKNKRPIHRIEPQYWKQIEDFDKIVSPIFKTLNRWTEIKKYRNNYVAHGSRADWKDGNKLKIAGQEPYDAPRAFYEFQILHDLIHLIFGLMSQEFKAELIDAYFTAKSLKCVMNPKKDNTQIDQELLDMVTAFNVECKLQGKGHSLNVPEIEYPSLKKMVEEMNEFNHPLPHMNNYIRNNLAEIVLKIKEQDNQ